MMSQDYEQPRWMDWMRAGLLLLSGIAAIVVSLMSGLDFLLGNLEEIDILHILLAVTGVVALSFGLEHVFEFHRWSKNLEELKTKLEAAHADVTGLMIRLGGGKPIPGEINVFKSLERLIQEAKTDISGLTVGQTPRVGEEYEKLIIEKLRDPSCTVNFRSAYAVDFENVPDKFARDLEYRRNLHRNASIEDKFTFYFLNEVSQIGFDILISDSRHVMIGIYNANNKTYRGGVLFTESSAVAGHFSNWFHGNVLASAVSYEKFLEKATLPNSTTKPMSKDVDLPSREVH